MADIDIAEIAGLDNIPWQPKPRRVKTPTILQMEAVECGAAALAIVMGYYKCFVPLESLREDCAVSRDGSKASSVVVAAKQHGFEAKGMRCELENLDNVELPFIAFWNFNHFLVVEGFGKDKVFLNDPGTGPRTVTAEEFDCGYTGVILTVKPGEGFVQKGKPVSIVESLKLRMENNYLTLIYLVCIGLLLVIPGLLVPVFNKMFIDNYIGDQMEGWLRPLLLGMVITFLAKGLFTWMQRYYLTRFETKLDLRDSSRFFWHILHLPIVFFSQRSTGDLSSRVLLNSKIAKIIASDVARVFLNIFVIAFYLLLMMVYSKSLALLSLSIAGLNFFIVKKVTRIRKDKSIQIGLSMAQFSGTALNGIRTIETLKACGRENDFLSKLLGTQAKITNARQAMAGQTTAYDILTSVLMSLNSTAILAVGAYFIISGQMTVGTLVAFQALTGSFMAPINDLVNISSVVQGLTGDMAKVDDVMKHDAIPQPSKDAAESNKKLMGYIQLNDVSFGYNRTEPALLENFSLSLAPGQRIALVGSSGSGKSTVAKLITRIYDPWDGNINIDDQPVGSIPLAQFYSSVAIVDQDIRMFSGSIRDNITMWDDTISNDDVIKAAKDACIHDDIVTRAGGYDSSVNESGSNFSGGQRQRIEIASALAKNPRILILDEATSALDPMVEKEIDENLRRRGCSCIIVAHRLSTIRDCDEIIVLHYGEVLERGTHDELMVKEDGAYAKLVGTMGGGA